MTGECPACSYRIRLRRDGTMMRHKLYHGGAVQWRYCVGGRMPPLEVTP